MAYSLYLSIFTFDFLFYLDILTELFSITNVLSQHLQKIDFDYTNVKEFAECTITKIQSFDNEEFERFWTKNTNLANKFGIDLPADPRIRKKPKYLLN